MKNEWTKNESNTNPYSPNDVIDVKFSSGQQHNFNQACYHDFSVDANDVILYSRISVKKEVKR